jgi:hypothetical protein
MNNKYLAILTSIILITGLSPPLLPAHAHQFVRTLTFHDVLVKHSLLSLSSPRESVPSSPTDRGAPRTRKGGAGRLKAGAPLKGSELVPRFPFGAIT